MREVSKAQRFRMRGAEFRDAARQVAAAVAEHPCRRDAYLVPQRFKLLMSTGTGTGTGTQHFVDKPQTRASIVLCSFGNLECIGLA